MRERAGGRWSENAKAPTYPNNGVRAEQERVREGNGNVCRCDALHNKYTLMALCARNKKEFTHQGMRHLG